MDTNTATVLTLFIIWGLPLILLGVVAYFVLKD